MKKILLTLLCVGWISGRAQSVEENLQKYWRYRERLVKDFVKVGADDGNSVVMSARSIGFAYDGATLNDEGLPPSRIYYQDATIYQGHYLLTLATEYELLQQVLNSTTDGNDYTAAQRRLESTRSEIYFALKAFHRFGEDFNSDTELFFNLPSVGIHSRDDVGYNYHQNYQNDYSETFGRNADFILTHSDTNPIEMWGPNAGQVNPNAGGNVMSLDQITSMFTGLMAVYRLVGTELVQPSAEYPALSLKAEARAIALKIIDYIIKPANGCGSNCYTFNIYHPNDIFRPAGYELTFQAPFLINIAYNFDHPLWVHKVQTNDVHDMKMAIQVHPQEILDIINNADFPGLFFGLNCHNQIAEMAELRLAVKAPVTVATIEYAPLYYLYEDVQNQWVDFSVGGQPCMQIGSELEDLIESFDFDVEGVFCDNINWRTLIADHLILENVAYWGPLALQHLLGLDEGYFCLPYSDLGNQVRARINDDNVHIFCELSAVANAWNPQYFQWLADQSGMHWIGMLRSVLYPGSTPIANLSKSTIEDLYLNTAPCEGPWDDPQTISLPTPNTTAGWRAANRLFHPSDAALGIPDKSFRGEFSGIDYMVYHNLYHCTWEEELPSYLSDSGCNCLEEISPANTLNLPLTVAPKFQNYDDYSINSPSYLSHDFTVVGQGLLEVKNDFVICSPAGTNTELLFQGSSKMKLYAGYELTINEGSALILDESSEFEAGLYPMGDILEDNVSRICIKNGARLEVRSGAKFSPYVRLQIIVEDGGKLFINGGEMEFTSSCSGCSISLKGENAKLEILDGVVENLSSLGVSLKLENGAKMNLESGVLDLSPGYMIMNEGVDVSATNSHIRFGSAECRSHASSLDMINSILTFENQNAFFYGNSQIHLNHSTVKLNNSALNLRQGYQPNETIVGFDSEIFVTNGFIELNGANALLDVFKSTIQISDYSSLQIHAPGSAVNGKIRFRGAGSHDVHMYANSTLRIDGKSKDYTMIEVTDQSDFWIPGQGKVVISHAGINLNNNGRIWSNPRLELSNVHAFDNSSNAIGGAIECWNNHTILGYSNFTRVGYKGMGSTLSVTSSNFEGKQAKVDLHGGSYRVTRSNFHNGGLISRKLENTSTISLSEFYNDDSGSPSTAVHDESLVEVLVSNSSIENYGNGIWKIGGIFSSRCSQYIENFVGIFVEACALNLSSVNSAGYNNFVNNDVNIEANQMLTYALDKGFNSFEPFNACNIWTTSLIPVEGDVLDISATNNIWTVENDYHVSYVDEMETGIWCYSGSYINGLYDVRFFDPNPATSNACPTEKPTVKPPSRKNNALEASELNEQWQEQGATQRNLSDIPLLNTEHFENIALDSALTFAASFLELYDSTGNDLHAVTLFHEILSSGLDREDIYTRQLMDWGVSMMKNGIEGMFFEGDLSVSSNATSFETPVQLYVDVLNLCTDTLLTEETYRSQFELELLKGQLFLTLNKPDLAREVFINLNACSVDSLEQLALNKWREEAERSISIQAQFLAGVSPDSVSYNVPVSSYPDAIEVESSNFYFGTTIMDPNTLIFVSCGGDPSYRDRKLEYLEASIFPNPVTNMITIRCDLGQEAYDELIMLDSFGRTVYTEKVSLSGTMYHPIELSSTMASGVYFIRLNGGTSVRTFSFVKQ
ncbi:MAG: T9SS type A sorting domain-containing protein [Flavobacteriales bacterium]